MVDIIHASLTDPELHEPKGISTATSGSVYIADGLGSGNWRESHRYIGAYLPFNAASPYSLSVGTTDTIMNPTFAVAEVNGFTGETTPNARVKYTGVEDIAAQIVFTLSSRQASGTSRHVEFSLWKNGVEIPGSRAIRTISSGSWGSISVFAHVDMQTDDYIEVKLKADATCNVETASAYMSITGVPK